MIDVVTGEDDDDDDSGDADGISEEFPEPEECRKRKGYRTAGLEKRRRRLRPKKKYEENEAENAGDGCRVFPGSGQRDFSAAKAVKEL